jgi:hypothetical protein
VGPNGGSAATPPSRLFTPTSAAAQQVNFSVYNYINTVNQFSASLLPGSPARAISLPPLLIISLSLAVISE